MADRGWVVSQCLTVSHVKKQSQPVSTSDTHRRRFAARRGAGTVAGMSDRNCLRLLVGIVLAFAVTSADAAVTLPELFSDHMVLQREKEVPVWGTAEPGEKVTVEFDDKKVEATADGEGKFMARLPAMKASAAPGTLKVSGDKTSEPLEFQHVLVGDVWICSGQSNMQWSVRQSANPDEEAANASYDQIRFFQVPRRSSTQASKGLERAEATTQPAQKMQARWAVCTPQTAAEFSAVGYYFGREIHKTQDVPVGLIQNAWGGMPVESFMSEEAIKADPDFHVLLEKRQKAATQEAKGPRGQVRPPNGPQWATNIYNRMVYPLLPYAIKGTIWYQGESNAGRAEQYRKLFPAMIADWRKQFGQGDFPFLFVQLANFAAGGPSPEQPADSDWAELREAQAMALKAAPNTGMAVIIDIGESKDIHPKNKQDVGKRLALAAQKLAYGKDDIAYSGPIYREMEVEGNKVRIKFDHAKGLKAKDGQVKGFAVAGEDQKFVWAEAKIDQEEVIVWSDKVEKPVAVRYGWANDPAVSLYNGADLPASPFRTDDWPMVTAGKK